MLGLELTVCQALGRLGSIRLIGFRVFSLVAEWIHFTLLGDNITHYKAESVNLLGLMNSATQNPKSYPPDFQTSAEQVGGRLEALCSCSPEQLLALRTGRFSLENDEL